MEQSGGIQASLGGRYATALFELARESKSIDTVEASLATIRQALAESADFKTLTTSPLIIAERLPRRRVATSVNVETTHSSNTIPPPTARLL